MNSLSTDWLADYFSKNKDKINNNNWEEVFDDVRDDKYRAELTKLLMASKIPFLEYLDRVPGRVFTGVFDITEVEIPNNIRVIGHSSFSHCFDLKELRCHPSNAPLTLYDYAFNSCYNLEVVILPKFLNLSGRAIFNNCPKLENIIYLGTKEDASKWVVSTSDWADGSNIKGIQCQDGFLEMVE